MKLLLKDFQTQATETVLRSLRKAARDFDEDNTFYSAQSLSAPTGSGKTVVATAVIERLFNGDEDCPADDKAVVLWLTDDPSLNEQTRRKMVVASSALTEQQLITIDGAFDEELFTPGNVYFLNIQKLATTSSFVRRGDTRQYTLWDTVNATVKVFGGHFILIIDEAHRGMAGRAKSDEEKTIASRFLTGSPNVVPVPVVLGVSATPERFNKYVEGAIAPVRSVRRCEIPVDDVRESGLLKDTIFIKHPGESQPGDMTIARLATEDWQEFDSRWKTYADREKVPDIRPIMVVQVQPKRGTSKDPNATATDMGAVISTIQAVDPSARGRQLAHSFGSGVPMSVGNETIRYVRPQDIDEDPDLRIVFFKESLATGWDCPRAEVMLSFQSAKEYTYIAQLIGRMVRTPLARRIGTDDRLNTVSLYLPGFDETAVDTVLAKLANDPDLVPPVDVAKDPVVCLRNTALPSAVFEVLGSLPTYSVPSASRKSQVARLNGLATLLTGDSIVTDAMNSATQLLADTLDVHRRRLSSDGTLDELMEGYRVLDVKVKQADVVTGESIEETMIQTHLDDRNIDDLLRQAGRTLADGLALTYWRHRIADDAADAVDTKIETFVLADDADVVAAVETAAEHQVQAWMNQYDREIRSLSDDRRQRYYDVQHQARQPELVSLPVHDTIVVAEDPMRWKRHLYVDGQGEYPSHLNDWEAAVLERELATAVAWYRNIGGRRALAVPYDDGPKKRPFHPDFIFFHAVNKHLKASIVDPHGHHMSDTGPKWRGLATYAEVHGDDFHRIDAVIRDETGSLRRLDLKNPSARAELIDSNSKEDIEAIFARLSTTYQ